jgi:hypothetical protein
MTFCCKAWKPIGVCEGKVQVAESMKINTSFYYPSKNNPPCVIYINYTNTEYFVKLSYMSNYTLVYIH